MVRQDLPEEPEVLEQEVQRGQLDQPERAARRDRREEQEVLDRQVPRAQLGEAELKD